MLLITPPQRHLAYKMTEVTNYHVQESPERKNVPIKNYGAPYGGVRKRLALGIIISKMPNTLAHGYCF